jgi:hypothetical protein
VLYFGICPSLHLGFRKRENWLRLADNSPETWRFRIKRDLTIRLDQRYWRLLEMAAIEKTIVRIAARVLRILKTIMVPEAWTKEVAVAKVIEFYVPNNFRKALKWVPEVQRGKILEFCPQTKKSA